MSRRWTPFAVLCLSAAMAAAASRASRPSTPAMVSGAQRFLAALTPDLRAKANLPFDGPARLDWHFVPRQRPGLTLGEMSDAQRAAAHALLRSALSSGGYLKVTGIIELETILREIESNPGRDADRYTLTVFGDPATPPWGWRIEGHHVSLNFSSVDRELVAVTPAFLGANPAEVRQGRRAGWRVLAVEEDLGRELVRSLDAAQRAQALIATEAPADIILGPGREIDLVKPTGVAWPTLTEAQRQLLWRLVLEYAQNLHPDLAGQQIERIRGAGVENLRFAWAGGLDPGQGHYYRIQGPTFVIEYDNTQNGANHVHTVWHDRERDFGGDPLTRHYQKEHRP